MRMSSDFFAKIKKIFSLVNATAQFMKLELPNPRTDINERKITLTCKENQPTVEIANPMIFEEKERNMHKSRNRLAFFKYEMLTEDIDEQKIKMAIEKDGQKIIFFHYKDEEENNRVFSSNAKGTERYNKKKSQAIQDQITKYQHLGYETFGLTITCNPKLYGNCPYSAWLNFKADYKRLFRYIREKLHGKIILVMESTAKGYPHAHLFLAFPKGTIPNYNKLPTRTALRYGFLTEKIKERVNGQIFNLQKVYGTKLKNYMAKYLQKMSEVDLFSLPKQKEHLSDSELKVALCHLATTITSTRQIILAQNNFSDKEKSSGSGDSDTPANSEVLSQFEQERIERQLANAQTREGWVIDFARLRAYLICICTNFPCVLKPDLFSMRQIDFYEHFTVPIKELNGKTDGVHETFEKYGKLISCGGCLNAHLCNFVINGKDDWFDNFYYLNGNSFEKLFNDEVKADDEQFITRLAFAYDYVQRNIHLANNSIRNFFMNKELQVATWVSAMFENSYLDDNIKTMYLKWDFEQKIKYAENRGWI